MAIFAKRTAVRARQTKLQPPPAAKYYRAKKSESRSPFVAKQPKKQTRKYLFGVLDLLLVIGLLAALVRGLTLTPSPVIEANDFAYHPEGAYAAAARSQLGQLKNRNKLSFDESGLVKALESKFPEITSIQVELPVFSQRPVLHLTIASPSLVLNSTGAPLVVDSAGMAVAPASSLKIKNLPAVDDQSGFTASSGSQVLSNTSIDFIITLLAECNKAKVPVASLTLPKQPQEMQLRTKDQPYYVKFFLGGDPLQETGQFLAARQHFLKDRHPPASYLDVRVPGKIFYK